MWARRYQRHPPLRLHPDTVFHLAAGPVPSRRLHHSQAPALRDALSQLAAPGGIGRDAGQLAQDSVPRRRLSTSNVSQKSESQLWERGPVVAPAQVFTHGWRERKEEEVYFVDVIQYQRLLVLFSRKLHQPTKDKRCVVFICVALVKCLTFRR